MVVRRRATRRTVRRTTRRGTATRRTAARRTTKRRATKRKGKAFGGYTINFRGQKTTLEQVFGKSPLAPSAMTKKIWAHVKRRRLSKK